MMIKLIKWLFDLILVAMLLFAIYYQDIKQAIQRDVSADEVESLVEYTVRQGKEFIEGLTNG